MFEVAVKYKSRRGDYGFMRGDPKEVAEFFRDPYYQPHTAWGIYERYPHFRPLNVNAAWLMIQDIYRRVND